MEFKIYNSKTNQKELFQPIDQQTVKMYVCGPTVYNEIHIGNARSAVVFDLLFRLLKYLYPQVLYVRNITDIDDKIIEKAKKEGCSCYQLSEFWEHSYFDNCKKLNLLSPTFAPRATETIPEIIDFISVLLQNGFAYEKDGTVFFDISELDQYGSLSNNGAELMRASRTSTNDSKTNQQDFVLWKPSKDVYEPYWNSPWGKGRPGWHIECSAMSKKFLGEHFDIHAGGSDLLFPHHENEQAQNVGGYGDGAGPRYWMHNAMLVLGNAKMSKSIGNIILLSEAFKQYHPVFLKFYMFTTHYRHVLSWTDDNIRAFANKFDNWIKHLGFYFRSADKNFSEDDLNELLNDLNTPGFFAVFEARLVEAINKKDEKELRKLAGLLQLIGLDVEIKDIDDEVIQIAEARRLQKAECNFNQADLLRIELENKGFFIIDTIDGYEIKPKFQSILQG